MFEAQLLIAKDSSYDVYGPWFPKGGDSAKFTIDVVEVETSGGSDFSVEVLTKNSEDTGDGSAIAAPAAISSAGITTFNLTSESTVKELVRYKYTVAIGTGDWYLFRMLAPVWYDKV